MAKCRYKVTMTRRCRLLYFTWWTFREVYIGYLCWAQSLRLDRNIVPSIEALHSIKTLTSFIVTMAIRDYASEAASNWILPRSTAKFGVVLCGPERLAPIYS